MIREGIQKLVSGEDLTHGEAREVLMDVMSGAATEAQIGSFLTALTIKGETIQEISAFAAVMKEFCRQINPKVHGRLVDTCGTGGDLVKTFNVSTTSALIVAGAGISVAKHGNRSVTSKSGSADVLERLGLNLKLDPKTVERTIEEVGIGFMFAPVFHPAMKYAIGPRREVGIRTVFNILGPITNPAGANAQVLGVYSERWLEPLAYALKELDCEEAMVVHGVDGLDEISIIGRTMIAWLRDGEVSRMEITPEDFGFEPARPKQIIERTPEQSVETTFKLLRNILNLGDPKRKIVLLNAAAGIIVGGLAADFTHGLELAEESMESGRAYEKLCKLIEASGGDLSKLEELERRYA